MKKFYVVAYGREEGIFSTYEEYCAAIRNFPNANGKGFNDSSYAYAWFIANHGKPKVLTQQKKVKKQKHGARLYAVRFGRIPGCFTDTKAFIRSSQGYPGAKAQRCRSMEEVRDFLRKEMGEEYADLLLSMGPNPTERNLAEIQPRLAPLLHIWQEKKSERKERSEEKKKKRVELQRQQTVHQLRAATLHDLERLLKKEYTFTLSMDEDLTLYTDASYLFDGTRGYAGIAAGVYRGDGQRIFEITSAVAEMGMTSLQAETMAVIQPLLHIETTGSIRIYTDCKALVDMVESGKAPENRLYGLMLHMLTMHGAKLVWVKGHADNLCNIRVDKLSKLARREYEEEMRVQRKKHAEKRKAQTVLERICKAFRFLGKILFFRKR